MLSYAFAAGAQLAFIEAQLKCDRHIYELEQSMRNRVRPYVPPRICEYCRSMHSHKCCPNCGGPVTDEFAK